MLTSPKISIITICRNEESSISLTCESIKAQTFTDFEWIVIDGGSTDQTLSILNQYQKYITHLTSGSDSGVYDAMNKGLELARGDYVIFMNGGDSLYSPDVLQRFDEQLSLKSYDLFYGDQLNDRGHLSDFSQIRLNRMHFFFSKLLAHQACFVKRTLFDVHGNFDPTFKITGDSDFFTRAFTSHRPPTSAYLGFVVTTFNSNGMSCDPRNRAIMDREYRRINRKYFTWKDTLVYSPQGIPFLMKQTLLRILLALRLYVPLKRLKSRFEQYRKNYAQPARPL